MQNTIDLQCEFGKQMAIKNLQELYIDELRDLYSAERQMLPALQRMINAANKPELKALFSRHLDQTREQIKRLDEIFKGLDRPSRGKKCVGMAGLVKETLHAINAGGDPSVEDAALVAAAQRIEHYEMAGYGTARTLAQLLKYDAAQKLQATLDEEGNADHQLSALAVGMIDSEADKLHPEYGAAYYMHTSEET